MSRLPYFLDNRFTDGCEALGADRHLPPGRFLVLISVRGLVDHSADGRIKSIKKSNYLMRNRTRNLPACSIMPRPTTLPRAPRNILWRKQIMKFLIMSSLVFPSVSSSLPYVKILFLTPLSQTSCNYYYYYYYYYYCYCYCYLPHYRAYFPWTSAKPYFCGSSRISFALWEIRLKLN
jgi:hypothetical protein